MASNASKTRGKTCAKKKGCKRKEKESTDQRTDNASKKKRRVDKVMPKKDRTELISTVKAIAPSILFEEIRSDIEEQFQDSGLKGFVTSLFENDELMLQIVRHHRDTFAVLYEKCKPMKNSFMQFQLDWYTWCSAFLLEEQYTLAAINISENDAGYSEIVTIRNTWLEFCRASSTPVPTSNPIMLAVSKRLYRFLLDHVSTFQDSLVKRCSMEDDSTSSSFSDGDDVYYRFGGAAICGMLKNRYKAIKKCHSTARNMLSVEISILQAMKLKDKSTIPAYLSYRDKGFLYFPDTSLIPFLHNFDDTLKEVVNEEGFHKHGDNLVKVCVTCFLFLLTMFDLIIHIYFIL